MICSKDKLKCACARASNARARAQIKIVYKTSGLKTKRLCRWVLNAEVHEVYA